MRFSPGFYKLLSTTKGAKITKNLFVCLFYNAFLRALRVLRGYIGVYAQDLYLKGDKGTETEGVRCEDYTIQGRGCYE